MHVSVHLKFNQDDVMIAKARIIGWPKDLFVDSKLGVCSERAMCMCTK